MRNIWVSRRRVETLVDLKWNEKWHTDFEFMEVSDVKFGVVTLSLKTYKGCHIEDTVALSEVEAVVIEFSAESLEILDGYLEVQTQVI